MNVFFQVINHVCFFCVLLQLISRLHLKHIVAWMALLALSVSASHSFPAVWV